ncbi:MAG: hypothetical protein SO162_05805 [Candidatus Onthomorpha sp.]|nr:hypothetical protein [Candidatus Onthomorpha sp.]MDY4862049.1 hypothetical protein [Candidatus Onthomorpha sp.]
MRKLSRKVLWLIAMLVLTSSAFAQRIAVLNFNARTGVTQMEVDGLSSIFNTYFAPKGAEIVERTSVDKILQEQKFQNSRFTNTDMVALGEMLNVSLIVVGDVNVVMEQYNIDVRVVNVQTGTIVAKDGASCSKGGSYRDMMRELGERLSKNLELEIEKFQITSDKNSNGNNNDNNGKATVLPKNMTTKITEDNSKRERTDVVVLEGFLKLYPEDLGEFSREPSWLIKQINQQERYGYSSWRLPSQEELDLIRSNGYLSGNKYMTKEDPSGVLMLVTTKGKKVNYPIAKQEISIHAGIGWEDDYVLGLSAGIKYKYKPFENYNIRLLGEIGSEFVTKETYPNDDFLSVLPILVGVNYEHRFNQNWSIFTDIGLGPNIPLSGRRSDGYSEYDYQIGFTYSFEAGFAYDKFLFSIKGSFSSNDYTEHYHGYYNYYDYYSSIYLLLRLGYRF